MLTDPLRLQVADRFETVLNAIVAGDDYFYTPHKVAKIPLSYELAKYGNLYEVFTGEDVGSIEITGRENYDETFYVSVVGTVFDRADLVTKVEKAIRDIRRAIDVDAKSPAAGSLGASMTVQVRIDESPAISYFSEDKDSFAQFDQKFRVQITGDFGDL